MQYTLNEEEMSKFRESRRDVVRKLRNELHQVLHHDIAVEIPNTGDPFDQMCDGRRFACAQDVANQASKGMVAGVCSAEEFNRVRARLMCKWEAIERALNKVLEQAEKSLP